MEATADTRETVTLSVIGMTCGSCRRHVEEALLGVPGVRAAQVDVGAGRAEVAYDPGSAAPEQLVGAVREAGYGAEITAPDAREAAAPASACGCCAARSA
ncbi:MAG: heavy-metal-associated domain-containing protein [Gemmatimonadota bacterium]